MADITLQNFASPLMAEDNYIKASFGGFQGSGKSRTASELIIGCYKDFGIKKPLLLIDNEKGGRFLIPLFKKAGIEIFAKQTNTIADVIQAFNLLNKGEIGFLFIDSLTKVWYQYIRDYKAKNRITFMTLQDWGKILPAWQEEFSDRYVDLKGSCVFTGRGGYQYEKEEDEQRPDGTIKKGQFVKSGVKMKMAGETPFEPDLNIWMQFEQSVDSEGKVSSWVEAQILKDRSDTISWKTFQNPTYDNFKPVIDYLLNVPVGKVSKTTDTKNLAPSEDFAKYEQRQQKTIEIEKIHGSFDAQGFSPQSKDDKALKAIIIKKFFGTISMTEIETMELGILRTTRQQLEVFFNQFKKESDKKAFAENYIIPGEEDLTDQNNPLGL
jgi:hypothetical protein